MSQPVSGGGALVLTPAHRVEKPETTEKPRAAARSLEERIAELEAAVDRGTDEFEPDGSEDQSQHRPDRIVYTRPPKSDEVSDRAALRLSQIALIETGPASDDMQDDDDTTVPFRRETSRVQDTDEAPMATDVPTVPAASAEVRAFTNPDDVVARIEERIAKGGQADGIFAKVNEAPSETGPQENMLRDEDKEDDAAFDVALSEVVAASVSSAEASEDEDGDAAPEDFLDQDEVLAFVGSEADETPASEPDEAADPEDEADEEQTADTGVAAAAAALPDEDALRLLVGRIIREELQGQLGERITRNVRKLVRREIMRALDSRDLV